jgi:ATP-dependent DNA ligase
MVGFINDAKPEPPEAIKPMLASKGNDEKIAEAMESDSWVAEPKLDGSRYIASFRDDAVHFTSRRTSVKTNEPVEKTGNVPQLSLAVPDLVGTVLDGEIMRTHELTGSSNDVTKIMGASPEKAIGRQEKEGWVHYHVWDILYVQGVDLQNQPLTVRRDALEKVLDHWQNPYVHLVEQRSNKQALLTEIAVRGLEGIILKNKNSTYVQDKRSPNWIKVKKEQTYDVVITGYDEPKAESKKTSGILSETKYKAKGWIGAIRYGCYRNGELVEVGSVSGMDDDVRQMLSENKEDYLGRVIELKGQEVLKDAIRHPRFVMFREDKDATECKWEDIFGKGEVEYK